MKRLAVILVCLGAFAARAADEPPAKTMDEIVKAALPADWRAVDPENTLYMELPQGRVIIELAPTFAPNHVNNIKTLVRAGYFDGLAFVRAQDNYVVQWADPDNKRSVGRAKRTLPAEFERHIDPGLAFTKLAEHDTYAKIVGFTDGFPVGRDSKGHQTWLAHCYGMVGAGRDDDANSGGGTELYAVIGQPPRHLDRNVTLVGRVLQGMDLLSALPRGHGEMGFYQTPAERTIIKSIRVAADVPAAQRVNLEALRTDTIAFDQMIESRRNRPESWFKMQAGHIDVCNVPLPVRVKP